MNEDILSLLLAGTCALGMLGALVLILWGVIDNRRDRQDSDLERQRQLRDWNEE